MLRSGTLTAALIWAGLLSSAAGQMPATGSVEGQVIDRGTKSPLSSAEIDLSLSVGRPMREGQTSPDNFKAHAQSDAQGRFTFANLPAGMYTITAQRLGYAGDSSGQFILGEQQDLKGVLLKLTGQSVIAGKVSGRDGQGASGALVSVLRLMLNQGKTQWVPMSSLQTDQQGQYRAAGLVPGRYRITASYYDPGDKPEMGYVPTYSGDTANPAAAKLVTLDGGTEVRQDIRLQSAATVRIRGRVVDPSGAGQGIAPALIPQEEIPGAMSVLAPAAVSLQPDGAFEIRGVAAGQYLLMARGASMTATQALTVKDKNIEGIVLHLGEPRDVTGTIQLDTGGLVDPRSVSVIAMGLDGTGFNSVAARGAGATEFVLRNVPPGRSGVTVYAPYNYYVKSVRYGDRDVPAAGIDLTTGDKLVVTLGGGGGYLAGRVTDAVGKPPAHAILTVKPAAGQGPNFEQTSADRNGEFHFRMLRPGAYRLYAWNTADAANLQDPDIFREYADRATNVQLEAGGTISVNAKLIGLPAFGPLELPPIKASVEGVVVNAKTGETLQGAIVRLIPAALGQPIYAAGLYTNGPRANSAAQTDQQGRFAFHDLESGAYQLTAGRQGFLSALYGVRRDTTADPLIVGEGQALKSLTMRMAPQFVITGKVTDELGEPEVNATASLYAWNPRTEGYALSKEGLTDQRGEYRFDSLTAGSYLVSVLPELPLPASELAELPVPPSAEIRYVTTFYPDSVTIAGAKPIELGAATSDARIDMKLHKTPAFEVRGKVTGIPAPGTPGGIPFGAMPGMPFIRLFPKGSHASLQLSGTGIVVPHPSGTFAILNVPAGSYILVARSYAVDPTHLFAASMPVEITDKHIEHLDVPLKPGVEMKGRVTWDKPGSAPLPEFLVGLVPVFPVGSQPLSEVSPTDGGLHFQSVLPVSYKPDILNLPPACKCFVKSIRWGGREIPEAGADFTTGETLEIVLSTSAASVQGTVADSEGKPVSGAAVLLLGSGKPRETTADRSGKFAFETLPPGDYQLLAWSDLDPALPRRNEASATKVTLTDSATQTINLVAIPPR